MNKKIITLIITNVLICTSLFAGKRAQVFENIPSWGLGRLTSYTPRNKNEKNALILALKTYYAKVDQFKLAIDGSEASKENQQEVSDLNAIFASPKPKKTVRFASPRSLTQITSYPLSQTEKKAKIDRWNEIKALGNLR